MTAPVLSPVRWWRDDATRYVTRGPQLVPAATQSDLTAWAAEMLRGPADPALLRLLDAYAELASPDRLATICRLFAEMLQGGPGGMSGSGVALAEYRSQLDPASR